MRRDSYRDELEAAHQRIAALEAQLARSHGEAGAPAALARHLLPDEQLLWRGQPRPRDLALKRRHLGFAGGYLFFLFWFVVATLRGLPPAFAVLVGNFLLFMGIISGVSVAAKVRQARRTHYAVTDRRVLVITGEEDGERLEEVPLQLLRSADLLLGRTTRGQLTLRREGGPDLLLKAVPEAAEVQRLLSSLREARPPALEPPTDPDQE